ncbi:MAG: TonB-dependent receptor plug domain-containing protein, partial [Ignavibacteria bacterium]
MIYTLSDVAISATKTSTSTLELANSITVIDSDEIVNRNKISVFELLKTEHGLSYTTQGPLGTLSNINIRGGNNGSTLVLVDGMKLNLTSDPANFYDFANLTTDNIDKIEVLRGPQSTLYGSDALSGIINIITKKGSGKSRFNLISEGGSYNTFKIAAGLSGEVEMFNYNFSVGRVKSDGFSAASEKLGNDEKDGYEGNSFISRFGINFNEESYLDLYIRFIKSNADYDQNGGVFGDDPTYEYDQEEFVTKAEGGFKLFDGFWDQKIGFGMYKNVRKYNYDSTLYNPVYSRSLYEGKRFKLDWLNNIMLSKNQLLTFGLDAEL